MTDNSEIDVEILCARPDLVFLTIWRDYEPGGRHSRVSRVVDLRSGIVLSTRHHASFAGEGMPLSGLENSPARVTAIPGFDSSARFYEYGIDWSADRVVFTITSGSTATGKTQVLWDHRGP